MMQNTLEAPLFFLHWGPGSHARVEAALLDGLPVHFWDQPSVSETSPSPWKDLVDSVESEVIRVCGTDRKVHLLAHCFGAQIAHELSNRIPDRIAKMTFFSANEYTPRSFRSLARALVGNFPALEVPLKDAEEKLSRDHFWNLIGALVQIPDLVGNYWGPSSSKIRSDFEQAAARFPGLNFGMFRQVVDAYMSDLEKNPRGKSAYSGEVLLLMGEKDPLFNAQEEVPAWKRIYPQLETRVIPLCGHFVHLEDKAASWPPSK